MKAKLIELPNFDFQPPQTGKPNVHVFFLNLNPFKSPSQSHSSLLPLLLDIYVCVISTCARGREELLRCNLEAIGTWEPKPPLACVSAAVARVYRLRLLVLCALVCISRIWPLCNSPHTHTQKKGIWRKAVTSRYAFQKLLQRLRKELLISGPFLARRHPAFIRTMKINSGISRSARTHKYSMRHLT